MELVSTIINTILLLALFWYQRNKNKVLEDRITEQSSLLKETKDVVTNQARAIESQKTVVDAALEYSSNFDSEKLQEIVAREIRLDYQETIEQHKAQLAEHERTIEEWSQARAKEIEVSAENMASEYILPLTFALYGLLLTASKTEREEALSNIPEFISEQLQPGLQEFDENRPSGLRLY
jgi:hypothetical protein